MAFDFGSISDKKWDPTIEETWKIGTIPDSHDNLKVLDSIYQSTEKKIDKVIKQQRLMALQGREHKKTIVEERMEMIEEENTKKGNKDREFVSLTQVTDVNNKAMLSD